jgi:hypothetical protein
VIANVSLAACEAEGLRVGDEVDFMTACREFNAELGGNDAGAAVGGIAGNANLHSARFGRRE